MLLPAFSILGVLVGVISLASGVSLGVLALSAFGVILLPCVYVAVYWRFFKLVGLPGPSSDSILCGNQLEKHLARCGTVILDWSKKYGHAYRVWGYLNDPILNLTDPRGAAHVLNDTSTYLRSPFMMTILDLSFGPSVFTVTGDEHKQQRKALAPALSIQTIQKISHVIFDLADTMKEEWEEKLKKAPSQQSTFDILDPIQSLALEAISRTTFSYSISSSSGPLKSLMAAVTVRQENKLTLFIGGLLDYFPMVASIPNAALNKWKDLQAELKVIAKEVWKQGPVEGMHATLLDALAGAEIEQVHGNISAFIFAGAETTSHVVAECLYELAKATTIQSKLRRELADFVTRHGRQISFADLKTHTHLPYLEAVTREALRMKGVLMQLERIASRDDVIPLKFPIKTSGTLKPAQEVRVRSGQRIHLLLRDGINVSEDVWGKDAHEFKPERWILPDNTFDVSGLPSDVRDVKGYGNLASFGDGPQICPGRFFAIAEFKIILCTVIPSFEFFPAEREGDRIIDFYQRGPSITPHIRGREAHGPSVPLLVRRINTSSPTAER